ncbi:phosphate propanoyltransferase [Candidatus Phytoplasma melaleucae]|uniref:Phosphate propanoyltransferase n=1 Tax=Candidatus Phytoplasma melaleucae TaxID=2982630 RepID=A0ABT9DD00_9MOLU|nr:phosphate propanoyltransferase ['Melaleuca sp.' phytoplasma]MDO8167986.1 phosphate propanoyltransferase ['Melaleuca sp.' phytoplasma]MDV3205380.1 phosphate propanoyltransferase [Weeping tea tree witches'-broom phytoplasma]
MFSIKRIVSRIFQRCSKKTCKKIPLGISNRHVHLSQKTLDILFGVKNYKLTLLKVLKQVGEFAAQEKIDIISSEGIVLKDVRVVGPVRPFDQVEISQNDNIKLKFKAPLRESGDIKNSSGATLLGPKGQVKISEGVIIASRHIHFSPEEAEEFGVVDKQIVSVKVNGIKSGILQQVMCRVHKNFRLELHLDTDDANAFLLQNGDLLDLI